MVEIENPPACISERPETDPALDRLAGELERIAAQDPAALLGQHSFNASWREENPAIRFALAQLSDKPANQLLLAAAQEEPIGHAPSQPAVKIEHSKTGVITSAKLGERQWYFSLDDQGQLTGLVEKQGEITVSREVPPGSEHRVLADGRIAYLHPSGARLVIGLDGSAHQVDAQDQKIATGELKAAGAVVFLNSEGTVERILRPDGSSITVTEAGEKLTERRSDGSIVTWTKEESGWLSEGNVPIREQFELLPSGISSYLDNAGRRFVVLGSGATVEMNEKLNYQFDSQGRVIAINPDRPWIREIRYIGHSSMIASYLLQKGDEQLSYKRVAGKDHWQQFDAAGKKKGEFYSQVQITPAGVIGFRNLPPGKPADPCFRVFLDYNLEALETVRAKHAAVYKSLDGALLRVNRQDGSRVQCLGEGDQLGQIISSNSSGQTITFTLEKDDSGTALWKADRADIIPSKLMPLSQDGVLAYQDQAGNKHTVALSGLETVTRPTGEQLVFNSSGNLIRIFLAGKLRQFERDQDGELTRIIDSSGSSREVLWSKGQSGPIQIDQQNGSFEYQSPVGEWIRYNCDFSKELRSSDGVLLEVKLATGSSRSFVYRDRELVAITDRSSLAGNEVILRWELDPSLGSEKGPVFSALLPDGKKEQRLITEIKPNGSYDYSYSDQQYNSDIKNIATDYCCRTDHLGRVVEWAMLHPGAAPKLIKYQENSDKIIEVCQIAQLPDGKKEIVTYQLSETPATWTVTKELLEVGQVKGEGKIEQLPQYSGLFAVSATSFGAINPIQPDQPNHFLMSNGQIVYQRQLPDRSTVITDQADYLIERVWPHQTTLKIERDGQSRMNSICFAGVGPETGKAGQLLLTRAADDKLNISGSWDGDDISGELSRFILTEKGAIAFKLADGRRFRISESGELEAIAQYGAQFEFLSTMVEKSQLFPNMVDLQGVAAAMAMLEERIENLGLYREHNRTGSLDQLNQSLESMYQHFTAILNAPYDNGKGTPGHAIVALSYRVKLVEYAIHMMARPSVINQNPFPWCSCASTETSISYNVSGYAEMLHAALCSTPFRDSNGKITTFSRQNSLRFISQACRAIGVAADRPSSWPTVDQLDKRGVVSPLSSLQQGSINRIAFRHYGARNETSKIIHTGAMESTAKAVSGRPIPLIYVGPESVASAARADANGGQHKIAQMLKRGNGILFIARNHATFCYILPKMVDGKWALLYVQNNTWGKWSDRFMGDPRKKQAILTPDSIYKQLHQLAKENGDPILFLEDRQRGP